jgi:hypothetical protein
MASPREIKIQAHAQDVPGNLRSALPRPCQSHRATYLFGEDEMVLPDRFVC